MAPHQSAYWNNTQNRQSVCFVLVTWLLLGLSLKTHSLTSKVGGRYRARLVGLISDIVPRTHYSPRMGELKLVRYILSGINSTHCPAIVLKSAVPILLVSSKVCCILLPPNTTPRLYHLAFLGSISKTISNRISECPRRNHAGANSVPIRNFS